jgi:hypothetical protein
MKYNIDWLKEAITQGKHFDYLLFWGHSVSGKGNITQTCLSQWYPTSFTENDIEYKTAEHFMMSKKALLFGDEEMNNQILESATPNEAKKLGRKVKDFDDKLWLAHRYEYVRHGNILKFSQHEKLKEFLFNTWQKVIVEASPYDKIWGIGLGKDSPEAQNLDTWQGLNLLGFALMEVREKLLSQ